jgi:hypothetical protein
MVSGATSAAYHPNGKIKINTVIVNSQEEVHEEGSYYAGHAGAWLSLGDDALPAEKKAAMLRRGIRAVVLRKNSVEAWNLTPGQRSTLILHISPSPRERP